ncbi:complement resistance protein TraT [Pseudodesulfovibrio sp.]|uniref:complement resistance protein TraT n=1 Tax=unclassified Pseudodesulfovibrio TaxID=2661612 RepID=UPI003B00FD44
MRRNLTILILVILALPFILQGCLASNSRMGMVQAEDGLMYGSAMSNQFIVDSSLFVNNKIKLRIRNTSGDPSFDLYGFRRQLENAYRELGYEPVNTNDFGILLDINVTYSGQVQQDMSTKYAFAGGALGGTAGAYDPVSEGKGREAIAKGGAGLVAGATLGYILGSYVTDDTYVIASDISFATVAPREESDGTTIVFGKDEKIKRKKNNFRGFRQRETLRMLVYAGGRNVSQSEIVTGVRDRMVRILRDVI